MCRARRIGIEPCSNEHNNSPGLHTVNLPESVQPAEGFYVAWLTLPNLSEVVRLGPLSESASIEGQVDWNKFLVVISLEESDDGDQERWQGPIAFRGLSRSGLMHTMAGHGPFDSEPCASFGFQ